MNKNIKAFDLFWSLYKNKTFREIVDNNLINGKIRFFDDREWDKIKSQNFISFIEGINEFYDLFFHGYNIGNCVGICRQLSYSYNDVDIVSGRIDFLKGSLNAEKEGGHCWLETFDSIIDTSLMLVIDKSLKYEFGYIEEQRITSRDLSNSKLYLARKEFVNDKSLKRLKK